MQDKAEWRDLLSERAICSEKLHANPYSPAAYLNRASCYESLGYPDLAAGDAYRALLLTDEIEDSGEYFDNVREALEAAGSEDEKVGFDAGANQKYSPEEDILAKAQGAAKIAYVILARTLKACGDEKSANQFLERGLGAFPHEKALLTLQAVTLGNGHVRREVYPWNGHEPDRFESSILSLMNTELAEYAPKCEIRAVELPLLGTERDSQAVDSRNGQDRSTVKQLGLFATQDIRPPETVLLEPSILTANNRLLDQLCDACSAPLPAISSTDPLPTCDSCVDIYFCSDTCLNRAQETYHPAICGVEDYDIVAKDPSPAAASNALYLLLVARTIAMAETQDLHPLDLPQVKYLWGDFSHSPAVSERMLPFNFETNIANPIYILMKMDIDPFAPDTLDRYDTWVLNTLFAKFRGVASAKMNPRKLRPDVAAVHPFWSLANHSCDPNVRWEWGAEDGDLKGREMGAMGFIARESDEMVRWGDKQTPDGGIRKGEEILNHYCDVSMDVKERREWAVGALGGLCQCERCVWEENDRSDHPLDVHV